MSIEKSLEREIRIVENDDSLTPKQKAKAIAQLESEARDYSRNEYEDYERYMSDRD